MTELEEFEFRKRFEMEQAAGNKAPVEVAAVILNDKLLLLISKAFDTAPLLYSK